MTKPLYQDAIKRLREPKPRYTRCTVGSGLLTAKLYRDGREWSFDGPAAFGPKHVRTSGRGPFWRGPVSGQFVSMLIKRARGAGVPVECKE